jgi:hypothetical protein
LVEVHGSFNATSGVTTATRVEVKAAAGAPVPAGLFFRLRGTLNVTAKTIGTPPNATSVDFSGLSAADSALLQGLDGKVVRVKLDPSTTPLKVLSIKGTQRKLDDQKGKEAEVEGVIDADPIAATNGDLSFTINGAAVLLPKALIPATTAPVKGDRVEVEGKVDSTGTLVATKVIAHNEANDALVEKEFLGYTLKPKVVGSGFDNSYDPATHTFEVWTTVAPFKLVHKVVIVQAGQSTPATVFKAKGNAPANEGIIAAQTEKSFNLLDIHGVVGADGNLRATTIQILPNKGV